MYYSLRLLLITILLFIHNSHAYCQQWGWGVRGGSTHDESGIFSDERVYDITSDRNGNAYAAIAIAASPSASIGKTPINTYTSPTYHPTNLLITSHSCNGNLRWKKVIGGDASCAIQSIRADDMGHVYVSGYAGMVQSSSSNPLRINFDTDKTLPYDLNKRIFIAQYDTLGKLQWIRMPESDTISMSNYSRATIYDMATDNAGNLSVVAFLNAGKIGESNLVAATTGVYVLSYDPQGNLLAATVPDFKFSITNTLPFTGYPNVAFLSFRISSMPNGGWIIAGSQSTALPMSGFTIKNQLVGHSAFVACFDNHWKYKWHQNANSDIPVINGHPKADAGNNIIVTGSVANGSNIFGETITTNAVGGVPFVARLSPSGSKLWVSYASDNKADNLCNALSLGNDLAITTDGNIAITGGCAGLTWGAQKVYGTCNTYYTCFVARLNTATGIVTAIDTIRRGGNGNNTPDGNWGYAITATSDNSVVLGGRMTAGHIAGKDTMNFAGGDMDFFIAKYGLPCGSYTSVAEEKQPSFKVYPNPVTDIITIDGAQGAAYITDMLGRRLMHTTLNTTGHTDIDIKTLPAGSYLVVVQATDGSYRNTRIVKQ